MQTLDAAVGARPGIPDAVDRGSFRFFSGIAARAPEGPRASAGWIDLAEHSWRTQAAAVYDHLGELLEASGGIGSVLRLHLFQQDKRLFPVLESVRIEKEHDALPQLGHRRRDARRLAARALRGRRDRAEQGGPRAARRADDRGRRRRRRVRVVLQPGLGRRPVRLPRRLHPGRPRDARGRLRLRGHREGRALPRSRALASRRAHGTDRRADVVVYRRILATLDPLGPGPADVVNATIFLARAEDTADFLRVHRHIFGEHGPALQLVCVDEVGHKGCLIEIEVTACTEGIARRSPSPEEAPAVAVGGELAFCSDQLGFGPAGHLATRIDEVDDPAARALLLGLVDEPGEEPAAVQSLLALGRLRAAVEAASVAPEDVGHLWLRVRRPTAARWASDLVARVWPGDVALTVTVTHSIPQSDSAAAAVSATAGGLGRSGR